MKSWTSLALLLVLGGCVSVQNRTAQLESPTDGAVIVRVLPDMASSNQFNDLNTGIAFEQIPIESGSKGTQFVVSPTRDGTSHTSIFAASLPPGKYRIESLTIHPCDVLCPIYVITVAKEFSQFEIRSGRLTDLGVLVRADSPGEARKVLLAHDSAAHSEETETIIHESLPTLNGLLAQPSLSWLPETVPGDMPGMFAYTISNSFGFISPVALADGSFVYGSENGVINKIQQNRKRIFSDIGTRKSVESVLVESDGRWLVAGELGLLKESQDEGRHWKDMRGNLPFGVTFSLHERNNAIFATRLRGFQVSVYRAGIGSSDWHLLAQFDMGPKSYMDGALASPQSFLVKDRLIVTLPGHRLANLDLDSGLFRIYDLPGTILHFSASDDGVLRCKCNGGIAVNPYESHDLGKTWQDSAAPRFMSMPAFRDNRHGVGYKFGFLGSASKMMYTEDGGNTWIETAEPIVPFSQLFYSKDGKTAYAATATGFLWVSYDDGKSWAAP